MEGVAVDDVMLVGEEGLCGDVGGTFNLHLTVCWCIPMEKMISLNEIQLGSFEIGVIMSLCEWFEWKNVKLDLRCNVSMIL